MRQKQSTKCIWQGQENENHSPWYYVGMLAEATCQQFHAGWMHTLQLLACLQKPLVSSSMQVGCTPFNCWHACRSHLFGPGLYVDIGLATSVSFCVKHDCCCILIACILRKCLLLFILANSCKNYEPRVHFLVFGP